MRQRESMLKTKCIADRREISDRLRYLQSIAILYQQKEISYDEAVQLVKEYHGN